MDLNANHKAEAQKQRGFALTIGRLVIDAKTGATARVLSGKLERVEAPTLTAKTVPDNKRVFLVPHIITRERYVVRLDDGQLVSRDRGELAELPEDLRADVEDFHP